MSTIELKVPAAGATVNLKTKERFATYASSLRERNGRPKKKTALGCKAKEDV